MSKLTLYFILIALMLSSCKSFPDRVYKEKDKFIQVGRENSKPVGFSDLRNLLETARENNTEAKMKYLGVESIQTIYASKNNDGLDSVVLFKKSGYTVLYDFSESERSLEMINQMAGLENLQKIESRLFLGAN